MSSDIAGRGTDARSAPFSGPLEVVSPLIEAGFAIHWLRPRSKAPVADAWSTAKVYSLSELTAQYRDGNNVGLRLGEPSRVFGHYLHVIDMDIRLPGVGDAARAALAGFIPEFGALPFVISGSGGESRHFYFLTEAPFRSKKLAHSAEKFTDAKGKEHWAWELELFGTGKQVAIPPSIHPDTGLPYVWGRAFDFDDLALGAGPFIGEARVATWAPAHVDPMIDEDDELGALVRAKPMGLTPREIAECLAALPLDAYCEDRDGWLTVGMALHHEFEGRPEGLAVWNAFSKQSPKFDERDQARVWKSFESSRRPTRMATLIKAAAEARFKAGVADDSYGDDVDLDADDDSYGDDVDLDADDDEDDDDLGDLLGESSAPPAAQDALDWNSLLDRNEKGELKPTLHNLELLMLNDPRVAGLAQFNQFTNEVSVRGEPGRLKAKGRKRAKNARQLTSPIWTPSDPINGDLWASQHDYAVRTIFEAPRSQAGYGIKISDRDLKAAVNLVAVAHGFHPVREYLDSLTWDGVPRVDDMFSRWLGAEDSAYSRSISRLTLLGAIVRVFEPGHKFDFVPILEGLQGKRKSTFIRVLARGFFTEIEGQFDDRKQMVEKMQGSWILELPELQGFGRHEVQTIKAFVSTQSDKVRLAWETRAKQYHRQCIFIGSTNDGQYLRDDTGGRRFWPIACGIEEIDTDGFEAEVDQIWAEARMAYREMRAAQPTGTLPLYITDAEAKAEALAKQEDRRVLNADDELAGDLAKWLDKPIGDPSGFYDDEDADIMGSEPPKFRNAICGLEVWCEMLGREKSQYLQAQAQHVGRALRKLPDWYKCSLADTKYGRQMVFRRKGSGFA